MSFIVEKVIEYFGVCHLGSSITKVLQTFDDLVCTFTVWLKMHFSVFRSENLTGEQPFKNLCVLRNIKIRI